MVRPSRGQTAQRENRQDDAPGSAIVHPGSARVVRRRRPMPARCATVGRAIRSVLACLGALLVIAAAHAQDTSRQPAGSSHGGFGTEFDGASTELNGQAETAPRSRSIVDSWYDVPAGPWSTGARSPALILEDAGGSAVRIGPSTSYDRNDDAKTPASGRTDTTYRSVPASDTPNDADQFPAFLIGRSLRVVKGIDGAIIELTETDVRREDEGPGAAVITSLRLSQSGGSSIPQDSQIALDLVYAGPFETRPDDGVGIALTRTHVNSRDVSAETIASSLGNAVSPTQRPEYLAELYYTFALAPGLAVRPNLQLISDPSGASGSRNTLVGGIKVVATF